MFLIDWYRQWKEARREFTEPKVCETCETLKIQVEQLRMDNEKLLNRILEKPVQVEQTRAVDNVTPIKTRQHVPWKVRQQLLEENDRHKAKLIREAPKPVPADTTLEELEDDVLDAAREREAQAGQK